jgi:hypothetical protein
MKSKLHPLGFNELLDSVRLNYSALSEPSMLFLPFNSSDAGWRFISSKNQRSKLREAHTIQVRAAFKKGFDAQVL